MPSTGTIDGTVVNSAGTLIPGAGISLTNLGDDSRIELRSGDDGGFVFNDLVPGNYGIQGKYLDLEKDILLQGSDQVQLQAGETRSLRLVLRPPGTTGSTTATTGAISGRVRPGNGNQTETQGTGFPISEETVAMAAEALDMSKDDARAHTEEVFRKRFGERLSALEASPVSSSASFRKTDDFVRKTLTDPALTESEILAQYRSLAGGVAGIMNRPTQPNADAYRDLLSTATLAVMDRLTLANPEKVGTQSRDVLAEVTADLKESGMEMAALRKEWNPDGLAKDLNARTPKEFKKLLR